MTAWLVVGAIMPHARDGSKRADKQQVLCRTRFPQNGMVLWRCVVRPSLRAQRSNPDSFRGRTLDCFAALAMTKQAVRAPLSNSHFKQQAHDRLLAARRARGLLFVSHPRKRQGRREGRAQAGTRRSVRCKNAHGVDHRCCRSPGLPCANGFNGVLRALPGERCTIAPVALRMIDARAGRLPHHRKP